MTGVNVEIREFECLEKVKTFFLVQKLLTINFDLNFKILYESAGRLNVKSNHHPCNKIFAIKKYITVSINQHDHTQQYIF